MHNDRNYLFICFVHVFVTKVSKSIKVVQVAHQVIINISYVKWRYIMSIFAVKRGESKYHFGPA